MIRVHIRSISVLDPQHMRLLPETTRIEAHLETPGQPTVPIYTYGGVSFPLLSEIAAEGARLMKGDLQAMSPQQAEKVILEWFRVHIKTLRTDFAPNLVYYPTREE
jgi:hypothetical protein